MTKTEMARRIDKSWRAILAENHLVWSTAELKKMLTATELSPETRIARGLSLGAAIGLGSIGKEVARQLKTEEQFNKLLKEMRVAGDRIPTLLRKATKEMLRVLPRRGGPGRLPKLSPKEASQMCDQVAIFIRQKHTVKRSLQMAAELSSTILNGKTVSARTLQKWWNTRDALTG